MQHALISTDWPVRASGTHNLAANRGISKNAQDSEYTQSARRGAFSIFARSHIEHLERSKAWYHLRVQVAAHAEPSMSSMPESVPLLPNAGSRSASGGSASNGAGPKPDAQISTATFPVVAIGASAGGLDACRTLLDAMKSSQSPNGSIARSGIRDRVTSGWRNMQATPCGPQSGRGRRRRRRGKPHLPISRAGLCSRPMRQLPY